MFKNIKMYFIVFLLFPFLCIQAVYSQECEVTFHAEPQSRFSKWMSPKTLAKVVQELEANSEVVYQLQYIDRAAPLNVRHRSDWISYETLEQFANDAYTSSTSAAKKYRIRHKPKPLGDKVAETAAGQAARVATQTAATAAQNAANRVAQTYRQHEEALTAREADAETTRIGTLTTVGRAAAATAVSLGAAGGSAGVSAVSSVGSTIADASTSALSSVGQRVSNARANRAAKKAEKKAKKAADKTEREKTKLEAQRQQELQARLEAIAQEQGVSLEVLNQPVNSLHLRKGLNKVLKRYQITTIGDLVQRSEQDIIHTSSLGRPGLHAIKTALAERGLALSVRPYYLHYPPKPETAQEAKPETATEAATHAQDTKTETAQDTKTETAQDTKTETAQDATKPEDTVQARDSAQADTKPETATDAKPETAQDTATHAQDAKPETATDAKPETATDAKPDTATEAKPDTAPEAKPDTATEVKPATTKPTQESVQGRSLLARATQTVQDLAHFTFGNTAISAGNAAVSAGSTVVSAATNLLTNLRRRQIGDRSITGLNGYLTLMGNAGFALKDKKIFTMRELLEKSSAELVDLIGEKNTLDVVDALAERGLALRVPNMEIAQEAKPEDTAQDTKPAETDARTETAQAQDTKSETARDTVALEELPPEVLEQKVVDYFDFTVRTSDALNAGSIFTVRDLLQRNEQDLRQIPRAGTKSIKEIKDTLAQHGLALRNSNAETAQDAKPEDTAAQTKDAAQDAKPEDTATQTKETAQEAKPEDTAAKEVQDTKPEDTVAQTKDVTPEAKPEDTAANDPATQAQDTKPETAQDTVAQKLEEVPPEVLDQKVVDYLDLGTRLNRALALEGTITTVRSLISYPETDLLKIQDVGKASVEKIKAALAEKGLSLGLQLPPAERPSRGTGGNLGML